MSRSDTNVAVIGGGLAGSLAAVMLARRGQRPVIFERGPAHDSPEAPSGRTINLALAARGIAALNAAGVYAAIEPLLLPMSGRIVHEVDGTIRRLPYGQRAGECIYSVSRAELNRTLYEFAVTRYGIDYRFGATCSHYEPATGTAIIDRAGAQSRINSRFLLATDGAGSVVRNSLRDAGLVESDEDLLDHGYREIVFPPAPTGAFALDADGLHIWPRGGFMLIALPNHDASFTGTLFLPREGPTSFAALDADPETFFRREFPDALDLLPDLAAQVARNPTGLLGTVHCKPWQHSVPGHQCLLLGDAAHAIVPFHGQGINAGFEDCLELDRLIVMHDEDWGTIARKFEAQRLPNAEAIAAMALDNYIEMRDGVLDPDFERRKALGFELERRTRGRFVPRYSMVMFHPEISYAEAERRGRIQDSILARATRGPADDVDLALALIEAEL